MKRYLQAAVLVLSLSALSGCGWQPLYNNRNMATDNLNTVWIDTIPTADGVKFRNALIDMFYLQGKPKEPLYVLKVNLNIRSRSLGIQKDDTATRAQLYFDASYTLYDRETLKPLTQGNTHTITGYNILDNQFTTTVSRDEAYKNGLRNLAERVRHNLALYFDSLQRN